ncbi:microtubule-associated proteins 1A/1B light chain 3A [Latimeria chalumnae]|uniref:microtubule-associated proteins 1A/1B light chain 3A n=1 Tax=Latimeria chalumnae TaxID=7897 RepID=UPI0003C142B6|nr:PREDICTED: microtubule-associated proteins 1A/1B light chain 3C [Latimeria chalumnae]|eukprot:XP_005998096.1 PREDICTED: microtubule-associated proteins 1A/1B light chain 3C [Latimeria chalumnae]
MPPRPRNQVLKPFKQRKSLATRMAEVARIRAQFPTKIPVIVERYQGERYLPLLDKVKFLVPQDITMVRFLAVLRNRLSLSATQALYLLVNRRTLTSMTLTMTEVYQENMDEDGFLYMTYASQEMFGITASCCSEKHTKSVSNACHFT